MTPRRWFHLLLGAVFIPLLSLPLVWGVGIHWLRRAVDVEAHRWAKRILGLALVDTLVVVAGGVLVAEVESTEARAAALHDRVMIGVRPDLSFSGPGARVQGVYPGSPAADAGLQAGDVIVRVAGKEVSGAEGLRRAVGEQRPGVPVPFEVKRGSSTSAVRITPRQSSEVPRPALGFFEKAEGHGACFPPVSALRWLPWAVILAALVVLGALFARRRGVGAAGGVWWTALSIASAGVGSYAAHGGTCTLLGGPTAAGQVFAVWGSSLALAGTALVARRFVEEEPASTPTRTWGSAVTMGGWYLITGALRLAVLLGAVILLARAPEASANPAESLAQALSRMQGPGLLLLALPVVLFGPVGEELVFRGVLQPALSRWLRPAAAVALTSAVFASMHWYYGLTLPLVAFVGGVLGWARIASGGLRAPIVLHMFVNALGFLRAIWTA